MSTSVKILCIGDIILDSYSHGDVRRISPEAPIPVLKINDNKYEVLGGCGNVAKNICAAGSHCHIISICGDDEESLVLRRLLNSSKNLSFNLITDKHRCTTKKIRFVSGNQQILRVDREVSKPIDIKLEQKLVQIFKKKIDSFGVLVISDYNKGMLTDSFLKTIIEIAKKKRKIIIVDPKRNDFSSYKGATYITPNFKELLETTNQEDLKSMKDESKLVVRLSKNLIKKFDFHSVITTRSAQGISIVSSNNQMFHLPSKAKEVFDVSGAGDTVLAYIASGIADGKTLNNSAEIANDAAGIAVAKFGTTVVNKIDFLDSNKKEKLCSLNEIMSELNKNQGKKIGFTNGCFDLIHQGHIYYLKEARKKCDFLILGLNSDKSIKKIKGSDRPILSQKERSEVLENFNFIDRIVIFNEETPVKLIKKIKPSLIFKGNDYKIQEVVGHNIIKKWGGKVVLIKCIRGKSTSNIIRKIKNVT